MANGTTKEKLPFCKCKRSACVRNYCQCYDQKRACGSSCRCFSEWSFLGQSCFIFFLFYFAINFVCIFFSLWIYYKINFEMLKHVLHSLDLNFRLSKSVFNEHKQRRNVKAKYEQVRIIASWAQQLKLK